MKPTATATERLKPSHHIIHVEHGGPTRLDNLILACRRHHRLLHRAGWHAKLLPDGVFEVTDPDGRVRTTAPPGALPNLFEQAG